MTPPKEGPGQKPRKYQFREQLRRGGSRNGGVKRTGREQRLGMCHMRTRLIKGQIKPVKGWGGGGKQVQWEQQGLGRAGRRYVSA